MRISRLTDSAKRGQEVQGYWSINVSKYTRDTCQTYTYAQIHCLALHRKYICSLEITTLCTISTPPTLPPLIVHNSRKTHSLLNTIYTSSYCIFTTLDLWLGWCYSPAAATEHLAILLSSVMKCSCHYFWWLLAGIPLKIVLPCFSGWRARKDWCRKCWERETGENMCSGERGGKSDQMGQSPCLALMMSLKEKPLSARHMCVRLQRGWYRDEESTAHFE